MSEILICWNLINSVNYISAEKKKQMDFPVIAVRAPFRVRSMFIGMYGI